VQRSGVSIPLPPLPCERIANLMHDGVQGDAHALVQQQHVLVGSQNRLPPQATTLERSSGNGLGRSKSAASLGLSRLQREATVPWVASSNQLDSMVFLESSPATLPTGSLYLQRASIQSAVAPQSFRSMNDVHDEISSVNYRLMERLLDQTTSTPVPEGVLWHTAPESTSLRQPLYQESTQPRQPSYLDLPMASLLGRTSVAPSPAARRESFLLHQSSHHATHHTAVAAAPISSLFTSYLPPPQFRSSLSSRTTAQDINMVTNALREAQHLGRLARSQRAMTHTLAGALQQRMGYDVQDLLPLGGEFNDRGEGR